MTTSSKDQTVHLKTLGQGGQTGYRLDSPGPDILEAFPNNHPDRPYVVSIEFPEYTSLCPVTGQPDFATIVLEYVPDQKIVESKSFKLYMFAYRNHQSFMETITNTMLDDFVAVLDPHWCRVKGLFVPRGGTRLHVFAEHFKKDSAMAGEIRETVRDWKQQAAPHQP
ncbi:preQ(1) synthase [Salidesulfovibrio brasiliensis]|uniref:preQ(1) synthase n=1 Tax=Salidesulfovibrio brasiliensis TaxID=221711 RepID=UPI0006D197D1|nr:preQ(1) synthase [Salidesulfovibrio brasiliensis]